MGSSFELVKGKLAEAEFFLEKMASAGTNVFEFRCYFSAFVSAARSVTFALMASMSNIEGFPEWYATKQRQLNAHPLARFFVARRNEVQKLGDTRINAGVMRASTDGKPMMKFYFSNYDPEDEFKPIESDVVTAAAEYLDMVARVVSGCFEKFGYLLNEDVYFSSEGLRRRNQSVEDLEEMLGFPRGWTQGIPDEERLRLLKEATPPKVAEWIGKKLRSFIEDA